MDFTHNQDKPHNYSTSSQMLQHGMMTPEGFRHLSVPPHLTHLPSFIPPQNAPENYSLGTHHFGQSNMYKDHNFGMQQVHHSSLSYKNVHGPVEPETVSEPSHSSTVSIDMRGDHTVYHNESKKAEVCGEVLLDDVKFTCGACLLLFSSVCGLHRHMQSHGSGYYLGCSTNTAFPKVQTVSSEMQTDLQTVSLEMQTELLTFNVPIQAESVDATDARTESTGINEVKIEVKGLRKKHSADSIKIERRTPPKKRGRKPRENKEEQVREKRKRHSVGRKRTHSRVSDIDFDSAESNDTVDYEMNGANKTFPQVKTEEDFSKENIEDVKEEMDDETTTTSIESTRKRNSSDRKLSKKGRSKFILDESGLFTCSVCKELFVTKRLMSEHYLENHSRKQMLKLGKHFTSTEAGTFTCNECGEVVKNHYQGKLHIKRKHPELKKGKDIETECLWCGQVYKSAGLCQVHSRSCELNPKFSCQICKERFTTTGDLQNHLLAHSNMEIMACTICCKAFTNVQYLQRHMLTHNTARNVQCEHCGKGMVSERALANHLVHCTGDRVVPCPHCNVKFKTRQALRHHMTVHSDDRPYVCDVCGFAVKKAQYLKRHMRCHTGERPYRCADCGMTFSSMNGVNRHKRIHMSFKPCVCFLN
ncbi:hypothetical protein DPMN_075802 [Dreissena polymorpha]|uniref:C2H2-type domain-containing protein n=1 Tax=Dreissena polymorpha TaxID=45954 RepID=A0A9D3YHI1_DREPO|nr:hypothetical protein DPMN_075802 [Dreissena polymorpha]